MPEHVIDYIERVCLKIKFNSVFLLSEAIKFFDIPVNPEKLIIQASTIKLKNGNYKKLTEDIMEICHGFEIFCIDPEKEKLHQKIVEWNKNLFPPNLISKIEQDMDFSDFLTYITVMCRSSSRPKPKSETKKIAEQRLSSQWWWTCSTISIIERMMMKYKILSISI